MNTILNEAKQLKIEGKAMQKKNGAFYVWNKFGHIKNITRQLSDIKQALNSGLKVIYAIDRNDAIRKYNDNY